MEVYIIAFPWCIKASSVRSLHRSTLSTIRYTLYLKRNSPLGDGKHLPFWPSGRVIWTAGNKLHFLISPGNPISLSKIICWQGQNSHFRSSPNICPIWNQSTKRAERSRNQTVINEMLSLLCQKTERSKKSLKSFYGKMRPFQLYF